MKRNDIISMAKSYLRQQMALFGDELWLSPESGALESGESGAQGQGSENLPAAVHSTQGEYPDLTVFHDAIKDCTRCRLGATRTKFVFGTGNPRAKLALVGEAPGRDEDLQGEPFVGRAGQLLTKIIRAIDLERADVYICNILKCRPPNNRDPLEDEVEQCEPYLVKQLELIRPGLIVALGRIAAQNLLKTKADVKQLRGQALHYKGIRLVVTYHPAAILRNPNLKRPVWDDFQVVQKLYKEI